MIILVTGVSGSGKSTLGRALARSLSWEFIEGDDYHPPQNVEKMRARLPLDDADRRPWLARLHARMASTVQHGRSAVVACSALKKAYRDLLSKDLTNVRFVFLYGDAKLIRARLTGRQHAFMPLELLDSQLAALEPPVDAVLVPIWLSTAAQVRLVHHRTGVKEQQ